MLAKKNNEFSLNSFFQKNSRIKNVIYSAILITLLSLFIYFLFCKIFHNFSQNLKDIILGFDFLKNEAGFFIGETIIDYSPTDSYGKAILIGLLNTIYVSFFSIILSTILGFLVGLLKIQKHFFISKIATFYIELIRNTPLLIQLFFWYIVFSEFAPEPKKSLHLFSGVFLSNRGLTFFCLRGDSLIWMFLGIFLAALIFLIFSFLSKNFKNPFFSFFSNKCFLVFSAFLFPIFGWFLSGKSLFLEIPRLEIFNFVGGITLTTEFISLLTGLSLYGSAFIAEIVRSSIQSINNGQWEAAYSLGLNYAKSLRLVIFPQSFKTTIPLITNQYLNLTKNSSLAIVVGYPDIVSIVNTNLNQTGQVVEGVLTIMISYLLINISISTLMNFLSKKIDYSN